jgi:hypothetical protein
VLRRHGPVLAAAVLGLSLLWLAVPRFLAAALTGPYDQTFRDLAATSGRPDLMVPANQVAAALKSRENALKWDENGRTRAELGALELLLAGLIGYETPQGRRLLDLAIENHRLALARDPAQPFAWARFVRAEFARHGVTPGLAPLLRMAIRTAPREPALVLDRVDVAFYAWESLDNTTRELVLEQVRIAAVFYEKRLAQVAKRHHAWPILDDALKDDERLFRRVGFLYRRA